MIRQIAIMSGKGGAGKTSVTAALVKLLPEVVAVDGDVNASNLPILLSTQKLSENDFYGMDVARIATENCTLCGRCTEICAFNAIALVEQGISRHQLDVGDDRRKLFQLLVIQGLAEGQMAHRAGAARRGIRPGARFGSLERGRFAQIETRVSHWHHPRAAPIFRTGEAPSKVEYSNP